MIHEHIQSDFISHRVLMHQQTRFRTINSVCADLSRGDPFVFARHWWQTFFWQTQSINDSLFALDLLLFPSFLCFMIHSRALVRSCLPNALHNPVPLWPPPPPPLRSFFTPLFTLLVVSFPLVQQQQVWNPAFLLVETRRCTCCTVLLVSLIWTFARWNTCITTAARSTPLSASFDLLFFTYRPVAAARRGTSLSYLCVVLL